MKKLRKSFIKKTLEVYYSQTITSMKTTMLQEEENKFIYKIKIKLGNNDTKYLRLKYYDKKHKPFEWSYYKNNSFTSIFLPKFIFGSRLKNNNYLYFLEDFPKRYHITKIDKKRLNILNKGFNFFRNLKEEEENCSKFDNFKSHLKTQNQTSLIGFLDNNDIKKFSELTPIFFKNTIFLKKDAIIFLDLNSSIKHITGFTYWWLNENYSFNEISFEDYIASTCEDLLNVKEINKIKKLSHKEYLYQKKYYEKK